MVLFSICYLIINSPRARNLHSLISLFHCFLFLLLFKCIFTLFSLFVEAILDKDNFTLEELLHEEEVLQECKNEWTVKTGNSRLGIPALGRDSH
ncbi:hypothetical protein QL285_041057 [Trifolium repens]|nr:hypothetical protein QL285_041057 [Trifolium repens]